MEIILLKLKHIHGQLAGIEFTTTCSDHLQKLIHRRDIQLVHLALHHGRHPGLNPWNHPQNSWKRQSAGSPHRRISHRRRFKPPHLLFGDCIQSKKGKEHLGLNSLHHSSIGHNQGGVHIFDGALGTDDAYFF